MVRVDIHILGFWTQIINVNPAANVLIDATLCCHLVIAFFVHGCCDVLIYARISEPESKICYRVVRFCVLETFDSILQTIFGDAVIKAAAPHVLGGNANDLFQACGCIHNGQGSSKAIQKQSGSWFMCMLRGGSYEFV